MRWSETETKRVAACLFLSALLHLTVVLLTPSAPDPQPAFQVVFRQPPRALETRSFDPTKPALSERQMQRLFVEAAPSQLAEKPVESPRLGKIAEQLPPEIRDDLAHLEKRVQIERSGDVNIDSLLLALVAAEENFREDYVRFPLAKMGADRDRAVEVVERAIEAMGGRKRLLEIRAMSAMVWVESSLKELKRPSCQGGVCLTAIPVTPYLYPVATWHYEGWGDRAVATKERYKVEASFDPEVPNPSYLSKNPKLERGIFEALFEDRWGRYSDVLPPDLAAKRHRGEEVRWHFIDRFLGEGVALDYLEQERHKDGTCHDVLLVDDRKFGHYFEALFDCRTALLAKTREKLTPKEEQWFRQTNPDFLPPTWITAYNRYQEVQGVLTPHCWERTLDMPRERISQRLATSHIHLQWAYNGADLPTAEPTL